MRGGQAVPAIALLLLPLVSGAAAQAVPNRTTLYLYPTDVTDTRALWVNPAGLPRMMEASVHLDVTVGEPGAGGRLRQMTAGLSSRGFSLGYQRDVFDGGVRSHTYRFGFATGKRRLSAGAATALYRGARGSSGTGWNFGIVYALTPTLTLGAVVANLGRPVARDSVLRVVSTPGATLRLFDRRAVLSADAGVTTDGVAGYAFGIVGVLRQGTRLPLRILARLDTDRSLRRAGFAFGLSVGGQDLFGAVATTPGDLGRVAAVSLYGVSTRSLTHTR